MALRCSLPRAAVEAQSRRRSRRSVGGPQVPAPPARALSRFFGAWPPRLQDGPGKDAVRSLLVAIEGTERGVATSKGALMDIMRAVDVLTDLGAKSVTTGKGLSSRWKLLWTTEKETLFILRNAGWFGTRAGPAYQIIDVSTGLLQNVITFPPTGAFVVDSSVVVVNEKRVAFDFKAASLKVPGTQLKVPPVGKGWFDTVYVDDTVRVAKDSRNDVYISGRDGPPTRFET